MVGFLIVMTARIRVSVDSLPFTFYNCVINTNEVGKLQQLSTSLFCLSPEAARKSFQTEERHPRPG